MIVLEASGLDMCPGRRRVQRYLWQSFNRILPEAVLITDRRQIRAGALITKP